MTPGPTPAFWTSAQEDRARAARAALLRHTAPLALAGVCAAVALLPADSDAVRPAWFALASALALAYAAVDARATRAAFEAHHRTRVLPVLFGAAGAPVRCVPDAAPAWVALQRSGLFPPAEAARPGPLLVGHIDGVAVEAGEVVFTKQRVLRKVRKIQVPVFAGAVFLADLGPHAEWPASVAVGPRGRWRFRPFAARKGLGWLRASARGLPFASLTWTVGRSAPAWESGPSRTALAALLSEHPGARVAVADGRHLVVALPGKGKLFRPGSLFRSLARDARAADSVATMRLVADVARALRAPVATPASSPFGPLGDAVVVAPPSLAKAPADSGALPFATPVNPFAALPRMPDMGPARAQVSALALRGFGAAKVAVARAVKAAVRSPQAAAVSERTLEQWDALRARLGVDMPDPVARVAPTQARPDVEGPAALHGEPVLPAVSEGEPVALRKEPPLVRAKPDADGPLAKNV